MNNTDKKDKPDLLTQMSSAVSHEIRNPLAIISNSLYFIKTKLTAGGAALDPKVAKHLGIVEGEVKHGNDILEEMLAFSRTRELQYAPASVNAAMKAIGYALRSVLANAVQAMPEGGTVIIEASHDAKLAHLTVIDSGPGLPGGDGEKVFEPFFTTKPRGIGLGLTIARKYLEQQGGTAKAENAPGRGARVTLSLPLSKGG